MIGAAFNDLAFLARLMREKREVADPGELQFLSRTAASHLWELCHLVDDAATQSPNVTVFLDALSPSAQGVRSKLLDLLATGNHPPKQSVAVQRNATFHYQRNPKLLRKALTAVADHKVVWRRSGDMYLSRAEFADEVLVRMVFASASANDPIDKAVKEFYVYLRPIMGNALRFCDYIIASYTGH
jgi:hypothetical protein